MYPLYTQIYYNIQKRKFDYVKPEISTNLFLFFFYSNFAISKFLKKNCLG